MSGSETMPLLTWKYPGKLEIHNTMLTIIIEFPKKDQMLDRNIFLVLCFMICKTTQFLIIMADMVQKYMLQAIDKNNKSQSSNIKCGERQQK